MGAPSEKDQTVTIRGTASYTSDRAPTFEFELEESTSFDEDGRIRRLEDRYDAETIGRVDDYLREHGKRLGVASI